MVAALKKFPGVQRLLDGDNLVAATVLPRLRRRHAQLAGGAGDPRDATRKVRILQIAQEMTDLSKKAREGKISACRYAGRLLRSRRWAASAAPCSRPSSMRLKWPSDPGACRVRRTSRSGDGKQFVPQRSCRCRCRATTASSTAAAAARSTPIWAPCWPTSAASRERGVLRVNTVQIEVPG